MSYQQRNLPPWFLKMIQNRKRSLRSLNPLQQTLFLESRAEASLSGFYDSTPTAQQDLLATLNSLFCVYFIHWFINIELVATATLIGHFRKCPSWSLPWRSPSTPMEKKSIGTSNFEVPQILNDQKTNEFLLISKPSTAPLQMLVKFRDCKNELMAALPPVRRDELGRWLAERLKDVLLTNLVRSSTCQVKQKALLG